MHPASERSTGLAFGRFLAMPRRRELLADGRPLKLGDRAFDVLLALIEARGSVVSKDALMAQVWPGRVVEENNLHTQISELRAALGADRDLIRTIARRGYQFTGEVRSLPPGSAEGTSASADASASEATSVRPPTNLPEAVSELIGRDDELRKILDLAVAHRLVTLTGTGGIGKTRLALATARRLLPQFADGVWVVEFSPLADPSLVPATVAAAVRLELDGGEASVQRVAQMLAVRKLLLVLDTCEHVIDAATSVAEAVLQAGSAVHILATSREPLRSEGEWVYPVPPLAVPPDDAAERNDLRQCGAVQLFVERARAAEPFFSPSGGNLTMIAAICRRLDGIPLSIELAAARAAALGIEELAARLDDSFQLLTGGRRTASPRHQTLRATLDWSYELLAEPERALLRRLAVFAGFLDLEAALAVAGAGMSRTECIEGLASLIAKSLVSARADANVARYRLLDTTRAYALEKLGESGEGETIARRHAEFYRDLFERSEAEWERRPTAEWLDDYAWRIDNLRAALDWAFSPSGDVRLGVALTTAAVPLWMHLSLTEECRGRAEQTLAALAAGGTRDARREMKLHAVLGASLIYAGGAAASEIGAACTRALEIAEDLDDGEYRLRSLSGLWVFHTAGRRHRTAMALAQRFLSLAATRPDLNARLIGDRLVGASKHFLGDQKSARRHIARALSDNVTSDRGSHFIHFQLDLRTTARAFLARILWLQGFPEQAMRDAHGSVAEARETNHANSLGYALAMAACPIALITGDLAAAEIYVSTLLDHSTKHALTLWHAFGRSYQGALAVKRGDLANGLQLLRAGFAELGETWLAVLRLVEPLMAEALGRAGQISQGLAAIAEAIARSGHTEERWLSAELLRVKGELLLLQGGPGARVVADDQFQQALDWARRQDALSWELRTATSLARLLRDQDRSADAVALLQPVYDRFTEGFDTADLKVAKRLLDGLTVSRP